MSLRIFNKEEEIQEWKGKYEWSVSVGSVLTFLHMHDPVEPVSDVAKDFPPVFSIVSGPINGLGLSPLEVPGYTAPANPIRNGLAVA